MPKILFYTDCHIRENSVCISQNVITDVGLTKESLNFIRGFEFVAQQISIHKPDIVFNLGDTVNLVDRLSIRELTTLSHISRIQEECQKLSIPHIILQGNHDIFSLPKYDEETNQVDTTSHISIGCILSKFCDRYISTIEEFKYKDLNFLLIPYLPNTPDVLHAYLDDHHDLMLVHNEFQGSVYESGIPSSSSLIATKKIPIFAGHIHKPQILNNITYIGSLISTKFDRNIGKHGIGIYDTTSKKYTQIENTLSRHYVKCKSIDEMLSLDPSRYLIKLQTRESKEEVEKRLGENHSYQYVYLKEVEKRESVEVRYSVSKTQEPRELLRSYLEENSPDVLDVYDEIMENREE